MRRIVLVATLLGLLAAGCGRPVVPSTSVEDSSFPSTPSPAADQGHPAMATRVDPRKGGLDVGFGEFAITLEAADIRPGAVTFVVHNGGKLVHGFEMKSEAEGGGHSGHGGGGDRFEIEAATFGPDDTIRITANLPAGVYEIECYVANHEALGMRTTLTVRDDAPLVKETAQAPGEVAIRGFSFDPGTVRVGAGTTVTWMNDDPTQHTVTARGGAFSSDPLATGKGYRFTFGAPGVYAYFCAIHPTMEGTVEVTP